MAAVAAAAAAVSRTLPAIVLLAVMRRVNSGAAGPPLAAEARWCWWCCRCTRGCAVARRKPHTTAASASGAIEALLRGAMTVCEKAGNGVISHAGRKCH